MNTIEIIGWSLVGIGAFAELWRLYWRLHMLEKNMDVLITCFEKAVQNSKKG